MPSGCWWYIKTHKVTHRNSSLLFPYYGKLKKNYLESTQSITSRYLSNWSGIPWSMKWYPYILCCIFQSSKTFVFLFPFILKMWPCSWTPCAFKNTSTDLLALTGRYHTCLAHTWTVNHACMFEIKAKGIRCLQRGENWRLTAWLLKGFLYTMKLFLSA